MSKVGGNKEPRRTLNQLNEETKVMPPQFPMNDKATKRVIAPFVRIIRKGIKPVEIEEGKQFSVHLQKKPSVLIRDLSSFLSDCVDLRSLLHETVDVLETVTKAAGVTLYMMDLSSHEIYVSREVLVNERHKIRWKIEEGTTVASYVAYKKEYVLVDDIILDHRFPEGIGYEGERIKSVLCVPVVTPDGECFAVIELYRLLFDKSFTSDDLKIAIVVTGWMGAAIHQNSTRLALQRQQELNDYLLDLTKCYIGETVVMEKMIHEIVKLAKVTLAAERGSFFVINRDRDADEIVADLFDDYDDDNEKDIHIKKTKVRFGKERGIAGLVAKNGVTVNVKDAYNDVRFNKEVDQKSGFITRSILCMPIMGTDGVLGVLQVVNKKNGGFFTHTDEILFKTFTVYSALALDFTNINTQTNWKKRTNNCYLKIIQLQKVPCDHEKEDLISNQFSDLPLDFFQFYWYVNPEDHPKLPQFSLFIMKHMIHRADLNLDNMMNFILAVRKFCQKNLYHNFEHSFSVLHCMHLILKKNLKQFSYMEVKALLIAALCCDVDHPGLTNTFLLLTKNDLSYLYEDYALENHQYYVITLLLQDCPIFNNHSKEDDKLLHKEIRQAILSKEVFHYFKNKIELENLRQTDSFDWKNETHRGYLKGVMMTGSNLSNQCKPFLVSKRSLDNFYAEYFVQGDMTRSMGICCLPLIDRQKQNRIPETHLFFLRVVVLPCVSLLKHFFPVTANLYDEASSLLQTWQDVIKVRGKKCWHQDNSIVSQAYV